MSKTLGRVFGPLGFVLFLFGLFTLVFLTGELNWLVWLQLGLGIAGLTFWGVTAFEDARQIATGRGTVFVATSAVTIVALLGVLVGANYYVARKHVEFDVTRNKLHTLADETIKHLKGLTPETKVTATVFYKAGVDQEYQIADDLLRRYKNYGGDNFEYEFVDYQKDPQRARALGVTPQSARMFFKSANGKESRAKEPSEEAMTNAMLELSRGTEKKVFFLTGHGEKPIGKDGEGALGLKFWQDGLLNEGFKSEELNLLARRDIPAEAQVVVIAGPQAPLQPSEVEAIKKYAEEGGRLIVMEDPGLDAGLDALLASWGVNYLKGFIVDPNGPSLALAVTGEFSEHPIAQMSRSGRGWIANVFPEARGLKQGNVPAGYTVTDLFKTGPNAWGENTPIDPAQKEQKVAFDPNDDAGPVTLGMAVSHKIGGDKEMRVVAFGDSDWCTNAYFRQGGNHDLALNTVQWLSGQESKITIRPKMRDKSTIANFNANERLMLSFVSLQLLPLVLIAFGLTIWVVRRSK